MIISCRLPPTDDSLYVDSYTYSGLISAFCTGTATSIAAALPADLAVSVEAASCSKCGLNCMKIQRCKSKSIFRRRTDGAIYLCLENTPNS